MSAATDVPTSEHDVALDATQVVRPEPAHRGRLVVAERAVRHVAERALAESPRPVHRPKVAVQALDEHGIELESEFGIDYPDEPLSVVLAEVRQYVSRRVSEVLGRPVRLLDVKVDELVMTPPTRRAG